MGVATETVFGLVADAENPAAIAALYTAKGRAAAVPLQVLVADVAAAETLGMFGHTARALAEAFWPGGLTLVVPMHKDAPIAANALAGGATLGIRVPDHPAAQALLRAYDRPLAASSANRSGHPPAQSATQAAQALPDLEMILDGLCNGNGAASTVVFCEGSDLRILREGTLSAAIRSLHASMGAD